MIASRPNLRAMAFLHYSGCGDVRPLFGNAGRLSGLRPQATQARSGAGGHVGGQDGVRVAVYDRTGQTAGW